MNNEAKDLIDKLLKKVCDLKEENDIMRNDYEKYQIIKSYEKLKYEILEININSKCYLILTDPYYANLVFQRFSMKQEDLRRLFDTIRELRNSYVHIYN
jgi:hypothetical protein